MGSAVVRQAIVHDVANLVWCNHPGFMLGLLALPTARQPAYSYHILHYGTRRLTVVARRLVFSVLRHIVSWRTFSQQSLFC